MKPEMRWMIQRDMPAILAIEGEAFAHPWDEKEFVNALRERSCIGMVATVNGDVVGYMLYDLRKTELHLLNLAVGQWHRRAGIGKAMIAKLIGKLSSHRRTELSVIVNESNLPAQLFFRSCGFLATGIIRNHHEVTGEDGYEMRLTLEMVQRSQQLKFIDENANV